MSRSEPDELNWLHIVLQRIKQGEATAVIAETQAALNQQPERFEYMLALACAHAWSGAGNEAEPYARQALEEIRRRGKKEKDSYWFPRYLDMAYLAVFDSLMVQGRFREAARFLVGYGRHAIRINMIWSYAAFAYFMDGDNANAFRAMQGRIEYSPTRNSEPTAEQHDTPPRLGLMLQYIQTKVHPSVSVRLRSRLQLRTKSLSWVAVALAAWEEEIERNVNNSYGTRLAEIVAALRRVVFKNNPYHSQPK
jgi:hypothetical protein